MKTKWISVALLVLALILVIGELTFLSPCIHADGSEATCAGAGRAVLIIASLLAGLSAMLLVARRSGFRCALFLAVLFFAAVGAASPGTIFPLCRMDTMRCRAVMQPASILFFILEAILSTIGMIAETRFFRSKKA